MVKDCLESCIDNNNHHDNNKVSIEEGCRLGCEMQKKALENLQTKFLKTAPERLLGSAVGFCWDGCYGELDTTLQPVCIAACDTMRKKQKTKIQSIVEADESNVIIENEESVDEDDSEIILKKEESNEMYDSENILEKEKSIEKDDSENKLANEIPEYKNHDLELKKEPETESFETDEVSEEEQTLTYIVVRTWPDQYNYVLMRLMQQLFSEMGSDDNSEGDCFQSIGKKGDNWQMNWPAYSARAAAMTSEDSTPGIYDQVAASLEQMKDNVERTIETPGFKENFFYILLGLTGFMLLSSVFNSMLCPKENPTNEDHYYLPPAEALPVKLPTYEECIKADKKLVVGLTAQEEVCKVDLSLLAVAMPLTYKKIEETKEVEDDKIETV